MKKRQNDRGSLIRKRMHQGRRIGAPCRAERSDINFSDYFSNIKRDNTPLCMEEIACAYWIYLYRQTNRG